MSSPKDLPKTDLPLPQAGGSYSRDPKTGALTLIPVEDDSAAAVEEKPEPKPAAQPATRKET